MTVNVSKPAINVREKLAELDKPTGIAGESMLRAETPQEQFNLIGAGRRNLIINGGFDVWQRGTSITKVSNTYSNFIADRWSAYFGGTYSKQVTTLPNGDYVSYFRGVLGTTSGNRLNLNTFIENGNAIFSGKYATCSLWIKGSVPDARVNIKIQATNGSGFNSYTLLAGTSVVTGTEWERHEVTLECKDDITNIGARPHACLEIDGTDTSWPNGSTFEVAQVQLELGKVATPFEHRSYGEELALCQRFYQQWDLGSFHRIALGYSDINNRVISVIYPAVRLRSLESVGQTGITVDGNAITSITAQLAGGSGNSVMLTTSVNGTPFTVGNVYQVLTYSGAGTFFLNGEL